MPVATGSPYASVDSGTAPRPGRRQQHELTALEAARQQRKFAEHEVLALAGRISALRAEEARTNREIQAIRLRTEKVLSRRAEECGDPALSNLAALILRKLQSTKAPPAPTAAPPRPRHFPSFGGASAPHASGSSSTGATPSDSAARSAQRPQTAGALPRDSRQNALRPRGATDGVRGDTAEAAAARPHTARVRARAVERRNAARAVSSAPLQRRCDSRVVPLRAAPGPLPSVSDHAAQRPKGSTSNGVASPAGPGLDAAERVDVALVGATEGCAADMVASCASVCIDRNAPDKHDGCASRQALSAAASKHRSFRMTDDEISQSSLNEGCSDRRPPPSASESLSSCHPSSSSPMCGDEEDGGIDADGGALRAEQPSFKERRCEISSSVVRHDHGVEAAADTTCLKAVRVDAVNRVDSTTPGENAVDGSGVLKSSRESRQRGLSPAADSRAASHSSDAGAEASQRAQQQAPHKRRELQLEPQAGLTSAAPAAMATLRAPYRPRFRLAEFRVAAAAAGAAATRASSQSSVHTPRADVEQQCVAAGPAVVSDELGGRGLEDSKLEGVRAGVAAGDVIAESRSAAAVAGCNPNVCDGVCELVTGAGWGMPAAAAAGAPRGAATCCAHERLELVKGVQMRRAMVAFGLRSDSEAIVDELGGGAWGLSKGTQGQTRRRAPNRLKSQQKRHTYG